MKKSFYLITILLVVGMWLGINFAQNQPLFSNPFADRDVTEKVKQKAKDVSRKAGEVVDKVFEDK
ncbi:MAG: hypothetical protein OQL05_11805 [Gammaproteobacteria bacterium]|nr:hypothetical protein [Gammaproteobacteria bacterium]MCW8973943.1 hypothetical protein [Gammaproteobacteria bacterium]MCW8993059.1 hypothetical protein [Gammaproteobacteria bacterium]